MRASNRGLRFAKHGKRLVDCRLSDSTLAIVEAIAVAAGRSRTAIIGELLDDVAPVLRAQLEAMRQVAAAPERAGELLADLARDGRARIDQAELTFRADRRGRKRGT